MERSQSIKILYLLIFPPFLLQFLFICFLNSHPLLCESFFLFFFFQSKFFSLCFFPTSLFFNLKNKTNIQLSIASNNLINNIYYHDFCSTYLQNQKLYGATETILEPVLYFSFRILLRMRFYFTISFWPLEIQENYL